MDNGRNHADRTMLGSGEQPRARCGCGGRASTTARSRSVEISGLPYGTESNPPGWDPERRIVVAYDAGNAVVRAWRLRRRRARAALAPRRARPRRPPDPLSRHPRAGRRRLARRRGAARGRSSAPLAARPSTAAPGALGAARGAPRWRPAATSSSCSTSTPARRRRASTVPSPSQGFLFPAPGLRPRRLLPVADHDRPRRGGLAMALSERVQAWQAAGRLEQLSRPRAIPRLPSAQAPVLPLLPFARLPLELQSISAGLLAADPGAPRWPSISSASGSPRSRAITATASFWQADLGEELVAPARSATRRSSSSLTTWGPRLRPS